MDGEEVEQIFNTVEKLVASHRAFSTLFARVEATEKAIQDLRSRSTCTEGGNAAHVRHDHEEPALNGCGKNGTDDNTRDIVKSITSKRLNEIGLSVSPKKSTWADLRKRYSPKGSIYSPKRLTTSKKATNTNTQASEMDNKLAVDEAYSQVATMTAYGVELLRIALSSAQVDRRLTSQASDIFATLCATLTDTLAHHRAEINSLAADRIDAQRGAHGLGQELEPFSEGIDDPQRSRPNCGLNTRRRERRGNEPVGNERSHPYRRDLGHSKTSGLPRRQARGRDTIQNSSGTAPHGDPPVGTRSSAHLLARISKTTGNRRSCGGEGESPVVASLVGESDTGSTAIESVNNTDCSPVSEATVVVENLDSSLSRRDVVRTALLRQGKSESAIAAYFNQANRDTNIDYDRKWRYWATWCIERGLDPCSRSDANLKAWHLDGSISQRTKSNRERLVKNIWSIVEGHPPPER
ncbi:hypothetical protein GGI09_000483 [Coemansia sp. S100]|nr:hypothetical protein LPJ71_004326 [Coemansia sp. S17]KAJ2103773.1 hypothetical protein GGI09_000483 [Coemansia sp. S100]